MTPCTHQLNNLAPARAITLARDLDRPLRRAVGEWLQEEATIPPITRQEDTK